VVAKATLFRIPILSFMMRTLKQIQMRSGGPAAYLETLREVEKRLEEGEFIAIFPETTRCEAGLLGVQPFMLSPFQTAIQAKTSVIPIVFKNTDQAWPKGIFGIYSRRPISVQALPALQAESFPTAASLRDAVMNQIRGALLA
jgi:1-acyl-sn-glycerol-3-phosphate acyltransferase